jgi:putative transposase
VSNTWRRKSNRLTPDNYVGPNAYLVTITTQGRAPRFREEMLVLACKESLGKAEVAEHTEVLAYVFMPDHVHLLIQGTDDSRLARFMKRFKQVTGFEFKKQTGEVLWQKSYHDHIIRKEEDLNDVASYIAANPVRAGLVSDWESYPDVGGILLDGARDGDLKVAATPMASQSVGVRDDGKD